MPQTFLAACLLLASELDRDLDQFLVQLSTSGKISEQAKMQLPWSLSPVEFCTLSLVEVVKRFPKLEKTFSSETKMFSLCKKFNMGFAKRSTRAINRSKTSYSLQSEFSLQLSVSPTKL